MNYLHKYNVELITKGPVFIGSGETINKKEAIFMGNKVIIIDPNKMLEYMMKRHMQGKYLDYMMESDKDLNTFFNDNHIDKKIYEKWDIKVLDLPDTGVGKEGSARQRGIARFVRDGRGRAYVPGSSLKGMLRTILTSAYILKNNNVEEKLKGLSDIVGCENWEKTFEKTMEEIDIDIFHRNLFSNPDNKIEDKINDRLRGIRVSDSEYISDNNMCICQKIDVSTSSKEVPLPLYRECIKPEVTIKFSITIDSSLCEYTKESIIEAIKLVFTDYWRKIPPGFKSGYRDPKRHSCILGGGSGFISKTILYSSLKKSDAVSLTSKILDKKFENMGHENDLDISPRMVKCTEYEKQRLQFGICILDKFEEEKLRLD